MSDDELAFYNAWRSIMDSTPKQFYVHDNTTQRDRYDKILFYK